MPRSITVKLAASLVALQETHILRLYKSWHSSAQQSDPTLTFQDLTLLNQAAAIYKAGFEIERIANTLNKLSKQLPPDSPLSAARIFAEHRQIFAQYQGFIWEPASRQLIFNFAPTNSEHTRPHPLNSSPAKNDPSDPNEDSDIGRALHNHQKAQTWFHAARALEHDDPRQAYESYLQVLAFQPEHFAAHINIGRLSALLGQRYRAAAYLRQALRLRPKNSIALCNLALILNELGHRNEAEHALNKTLEYDPNCADAHFQLATLLENQGKQERALVHYHRYRDIVAG